MRKTLKDQLKQWEKKHKQIIKNNREQNKKRKSEKLSERDLIDLMGMSNRGLRRGKGGAYKHR